MLALSYSVHPAGWLACKLLRRFWRGCLLSPLGGLSLRQTTVPELPGDDWVRVRTLMGGICGTDIAILAQCQPPDSILQAVSSMPMILGHENVAVVETAGTEVDGSWVGRRVCVEPTLCCKVRGIAPPCRRCREGEFGACESFGEDGAGTAQLPPGTSIGYNSRTGGAFGEYFVAHRSQLVPVPDDIPDEQAVLTDPIACSLHAVLRADMTRVDSALVYGAGMMGLGVVASLRALGYAGRIDALDRCAYPERTAGAMGADNFLTLPDGGCRRGRRIAELTGAKLHETRFGNYMISGGYDVVFDCVGSRQSIGESLKWTRSRGQVVLVGTGCGGNVDLTPIWLGGLKVVGAYGRQIERLAGGRQVGTYQLVHELMTAGKLNVAGLLTHTFKLSDYRGALGVAMNKAAHSAVKVAFDLR